jgi:SAM-dependent methyltransferase
MSTPLEQHQLEIERNRRAWESKPLLREIYHGFYREIARHIDPSISGAIVEIGSGIGNLKSQFPQAICTDLFPNPWLDLVCDGYELPFRDHSLSHLILFDVFHHLEAPFAFLKEARRVLNPQARLIIFEPYISLMGRLVFGLFHHEPIGMNAPIHRAESLPRPRAYYAAQGNATRLFFRESEIPGWTKSHSQIIGAFAYFLSGGFSKPALYPAAFLPLLLKLDSALRTAAPGIFGARCLIVLQPEPSK